MKKVYVITGSTSGIGLELVNVFSKEKDSIVFAGYRNKEKLPQIIPDNVKYFYIDMKDDDSIKSASDFIKSNTEKIDTIINCAGCVEAGPIENISIERLREQFNVNTFSHLFLVQNLIDKLSGGKVINISSMASFGNFPFISPYCASKRALDIFFNAFELENHNNIKVISVKPGVISTPIWEKSVESNVKYFDDCKKYEKELTFIKNNALKHTSNGLCVSKVADLIKKIDKCKNPKSSYTIGADAKFAKILSYLPQDFVNSVIKYGVKSRVK